MAYFKSDSNSPKNSKSDVTYYRPITFNLLRRSSRFAMSNAALKYKLSKIYNCHHQAHVI